MFIYKAEKEEMQRSITYLLGEFSKLWTEYLVLKAKIKVLEERKPEATKPARKKKPMTAAQKAKQRQYQKAYNERKKAKLIAEKLLTKETNVSS